MRAGHEPAFSLRGLDVVSADGENLMKIKVEVSQSELDEMEFDSVDEFKLRMLAQIQDGVVGNDGEAGVDWLVETDLEVAIV